MCAHSLPACACAAYALGFLDCKDISARCMLTIFQFFATKTDASVRAVGALLGGASHQRPPSMLLAPPPCISYATNLIILELSLQT